MAGDPNIDFTETHQVIVHVGYGDGPEIARRLEANNIICNYQASPDEEGWSKQGGYELYLRDGSYGDQLWEIAMEAGKPYNIMPATPSPIERIESGLLNYWDDMDDNTNPYEVGLG